MCRSLRRSLTAWGDDRCLKLANRVKRRLQLMPASGIFGRADLRNVWHEYSLQIQHGPIALESAWSATVDPLVDYQIEQLPASEAALLTRWLNWWDEDTFDDVDPDSYDPAAIRSAVLEQLQELAQEKVLDWFTG